jgi:hypothetical protein
VVAHAPDIVSVDGAVAEDNPDAVLRVAVATAIAAEADDRAATADLG